jgi:hypothetical protein
LRKCVGRTGPLTCSKRAPLTADRTPLYANSRCAVQSLATLGLLYGFLSDEPTPHHFRDVGNEPKASKRRPSMSCIGSANKPAATGCLWHQIAGQSPAGFSARWGFGGWALAAVTFESEVLGTNGFWERAGLLLLLATHTAKSGQRTVPSRKAEKRIK